MTSRNVFQLEEAKSPGLEALELQGELSLPSPPRRKPHGVREEASNSQYATEVSKKSEKSTVGYFLGLSSPSIVPEGKVLSKASVPSEGNFRQRIEKERQRFLEELEKIDESLKQKKEILEAKQRSLEYKRRWLLRESKQPKNPPNGKHLKRNSSEGTLLSSVTQRILSENRLRAAAAHAALQPFFCQTFDEEVGSCERGVFASYPPVSLYSAPEEITDVVKVVECFPVVSAKLSAIIRDRLEQKLNLRQKLLEEFMELREKWIKQLRSVEDQLSKEETEALLQRDWYVSFF